MAGSYHVDSSSNAGTDTVPTAAELAGNFSAFSNVIYDPASTSGTFRGGQPLSHSFSGQHHPHVAVQHHVERDRRQQPLRASSAGVGSITNTGPSGNIVTSGTGNYFNLTNQFRVDHNFSDKLKASLSFSNGNQHQPANNVNIVYAPYDQYQTLTVHASKPRRSVGHLHFQPHFHQRDEGRRISDHRE